MGFLSWLWDWIKSLFGFGESIYNKERKELEDELRLTNLIKKGKNTQKKEDNQIFEITVILTHIFNKLPEREDNSRILFFGQTLTYKQAILVLIKNLKKLIGTSTSIKQVETTLKNIWGGWIVIRLELSKKGFKREVDKIGYLFKELSVELKWQETTAGQKLELANEQLKLIKSEANGK